MKRDYIVAFHTGGNSWWWTMLSSNGKPVAMSVGEYRSKGAAKRAVERLLKRARAGLVEVLG